MTTESLVVDDRTGSSDLRDRIYCDGYWIKAYPVPDDSLFEKKRLIDALTRRLFNHVEHGINVPGARLDEARAAFVAEDDPARRRVKGAMLAGALFNRATEVFTKLVEIQALGLEIRADDELMRQCGEYLKEALELGKLVLHRTGEEGIDELWGEPFKAFAYPIAEFYKSRYVKIAQTMRAIDGIAAALERTLEVPEFSGIAPLVADFARAAKSNCETLRTDPDVFDVWASFVVSGERLVAFRPMSAPAAQASDPRWAEDAIVLVREGHELVRSIARARVPMPKSARELIARCEALRARVGSGAPASEDSARESRSDPPSDRPRDDLLQAH